MCPYYVDPTARDPTKIVRITRGSVYLPFLTQVAVLLLFFAGFYQQLEELRKTNKLGAFDDDTFRPLGITMAIGSLILVVLQLNFSTSFIIYNATVWITYRNRHEMARISSKIYVIFDHLHQRYGATWSPKRLGLVVNWTTFVIISYHVIVIGLFTIFLNGNRADWFVMLPLSYLLQLIASSISTLDNILIMFLLNQIFELFESAPLSKHNRSFLQTFYESLDLLEEMSQSYGFREFLNVANEYFEILTQTFFVFFVVMNTTGSSWPMILMAANNILPRAMKLLLVAHYGENINESVGRVQSELTFNTWFNKWPFQSNPFLDSALQNRDYSRLSEGSWNAGHLLIAFLAL